MLLCSRGIKNGVPLFNPLGPLINPARPTYHCWHVYAPELVKTYAVTAVALGHPTYLLWFMVPVLMKSPYMVKPKWQKLKTAKLTTSP